MVYNGSFDGPVWMVDFDQGLLVLMILGKEQFSNYIAIIIMNI
jgi:hypothetical protein